MRASTRVSSVGTFLAALLLCIGQARRIQGSALRIKNQKLQPEGSTRVAPNKLRVSLMVNKRMLNQLLRHELGFIFRWFEFSDGVVNMFQHPVDQMRSELRAAPIRPVPRGRSSSVRLQATHINYETELRGRKIGFKDTTLTVDVSTWAVDGKDPEAAETGGFLTNFDSFDAPYPHLDITPRGIAEPGGWKVKALIAQLVAGLVMGYKDWDISSSFGYMRTLGTIYNFRIMQFTADDHGNLGIAFLFIRHDITDPVWDWSDDDEDIALPFHVVTDPGKAKLALYMDRPLYDFIAGGRLGSMADVFTSVVTSASAQGVARAEMSQSVAAGFINLMLHMTGLSPNANIDSVESIIRSTGPGVTWEVDVTTPSASWFGRLMGFAAYRRDDFIYPCPASITNCQDDRCNQAQNKCGACIPGFDWDGSRCKPFRCTMGLREHCLTCMEPQAARKVDDHCKTCNPGYAIKGYYCEETFKTACPGTITNCKPNKCNEAKNKCGDCAAGYTWQTGNCRPFPCATGSGKACQACKPIMSRKVVNHCETCNPGYSQKDGQTCEQTHEIGQAGQNGCAEYLSEQECMNAAVLDRMTFEGVVTRHDLPRGCVLKLASGASKALQAFVEMGKYAFNKHMPGSTHASTAPVCKELLKNWAKGKLIKPYGDLVDDLDSAVEYFKEVANSSSF